MKITKKALLLFAIGFISLIFISAKRIHHEKWYQEKWCSDRGGKTEVVLADKTRCDCLTATHAVEFDFGNKCGLNQ